MAYKVILFHYIPGDSILHKTHPGIKLIITLYFCILIFFLEFPVLILILLTEILLIVMAKIRIKQILREMNRFFLLLLIIFLFHAYSSEQFIFIFSIIPLPSLNGFLAGGFIILKIIMVIFPGIMLTSTTKVSQLRDALYSFFFKIPSFPAARVATLMGLTMRSIPLLLDKMQEVDESRKARCIQSNRNPYYHIVTFVLPLLIHVFKQTDSIACSMEARCYTESVKPESGSLCRRDYIIFILSLFIGVLGLVINFFFPVFT